MEVSYMQFALSVILIVISVYLQKKDKSNKEKTPAKKKIVAKKYLKHLINQMNFTLEKEKKDLEVKNKKALLPGISEIKDSVIPPLTIIYATQSNTAKKFAETIFSESKILGIPSIIKNISELTLSDLEININICFFISTYGEGGPSDDCYEFNKIIEKYKDSGYKNEGEYPLNSLNFTVFGLGSKKYEFFNEMAKKLKKFLLNSKSNELHYQGEGDDSKNIQKDFELWKTEYWSSLYKYFDGKKSIFEEKSQKIIQKIEENNQDYEIKILNENDIPAGLFNVEEDEFDFSTKRYINSKKLQIESIEELRKSNKNGSTLKITYKVPDNFKYEVGDNIGIYPENDETAVNLIIEKLKYDSEKVLIVEKSKQKIKSKIRFPHNIKIKEILKKFIDLSQNIKKDLLSKLLKYCFDENQYNELNVILMREGKLREFENRNLNIVDFLTIYDSIIIPFDEFYNLMPKISPRFYTVASSLNYKKDKMEIAISLVNFTSNNTTRYGLTSKYYKELFDNKRVCETNVVVRESTFRLPKDANTPILMIGTGTGVAPFISFLQENYKLFIDKQPFFSTFLYFGSKNKDSDFIYQEEIEFYNENSALNSLKTAFSRDQDNKVYVQDLIYNDKELIINLLVNQKCNVYVCGGINMGNETKTIIKKILEEHFNNSEKSHEYLNEMEKSNKFVMELWG